MTFDDLKIVNAKGNAFPYANEIGDDWTPWGDEKDCDSYAVWKYEQLVLRGWPKEALRLATCWVETGGYHAVLLVDFQGQTWVLDNRYPHPTEYDILPYMWDRLQIAGTQQWEQA